ncbi:unnamed protein product [Heligmosomoides polygyrus]|uniref:EGF-like domain-containing protein n=1 Tax=Heligmosomoides polygyrus TaxID=6339 RepID=A0A183F4R0_HELPZ|nr:unnamed protein product [Heligmosomoides polygyrus]
MLNIVYQITLLEQTNAVCICDEEFAGARCTVNKTELAFYSDTASSFISAPTLSAAALFCTEIALILAHILLSDELMEKHAEVVMNTQFAASVATSEK